MGCCASTHEPCWGSRGAGCCSSARGCLHPAGWGQDGDRPRVHAGDTEAVRGREERVQPRAVPTHPLAFSRRKQELCSRAAGAQHCWLSAALQAAHSELQQRCSRTCPHPAGFALTVRNPVSSTWSSSAPCLFLAPKVLIIPHPVTSSTILNN